MATTSVIRKGPRLGLKEVFLPNFTLTLLRTPDLPPTFASFYVPLNLNKLDLRDYLWNCYGVPVKSVRSYIQLQKLRRGKPGDQGSRSRRWHRPRSIKKMTVEMEKPFVWPEVPSDLEKWDKAVYDGARQERKEQQKDISIHSSMNVPRGRDSIAKQAKLLLKGNDSWKTGNLQQSEWENVGNEVEVETDVQLPKTGR